MTQIVRGVTVRQILPAPFQGVVTKFNIDQESGLKQYLVSRVEADGTVNERWFNEGQVEEVLDESPAE